MARDRRVAVSSHWPQEHCGLGGCGLYVTVVSKRLQQIMQVACFGASVRGLGVYHEGSKVWVAEMRITPCPERYQTWNTIPAHPEPEEVQGLGQT